MRQKTQNHFLKFPIHLSVRKYREKLQTNIWKIHKASVWRNFMHRYAPEIFQCNPLLSSLSLQLTFFSEQSFYGDYSTLLFSYKHYNFSHVCLLVKMVSKTVTRSIQALQNLRKLSLPRRRFTGSSFFIPPHKHLWGGMKDELPVKRLRGRLANARPVTYYFLQTI